MKSTPTRPVRLSPSANDVASTQQPITGAQQQGDGRRQSVLDCIVCCSPVALVRTVMGTDRPGAASQTSRAEQTEHTPVSASASMPVRAVSAEPSAVGAAVTLLSKSKSSASFEKSKNFIKQKTHKIEVTEELGQRTINVYDVNNKLIANGGVLGKGSLGFVYELNINEAGYDSVAIKDTPEGGERRSKALQREILGAHAVDYEMVSNISEAIGCYGSTFTIMEKYDGTLFSLLNSKTLSLEELKIQLMPGLESLLETLRSYDQDPTKKSNQVETYKVDSEYIDQDDGETVQGVWDDLTLGGHGTDLGIYVVCDNDSLSTLEIRIYERGAYTSYAGSRITEGVENIMSDARYTSEKDLSEKLMNELGHSPVEPEPFYCYLADLGLSNFLYRTVSDNGADRIEVVAGDSKAATDKKGSIKMEEGFFIELKLGSTKYTIESGVDGKAIITSR